ncbi:hypothetical protein BJ944DRAFT_262589, partial [Cunninghamella echinulata]
MDKSVYRIQINVTPFNLNTYYNQIMDKLPLELVHKIIHFADEPHISYILGVEPNRDTLFFGGGVLISLENILNLGGDIKTLIFMKKYIPSYLAIYKAVCSVDPKLVIRVCLIWDSWLSSLAYYVSFCMRFKWGIDNIKHGDVVVTKGMYVMNNMLDNLTLEEDMSSGVDLEDLAKSDIEEDMYDIYLKRSPRGLPIAKILRRIYKEEVSFDYIDDELIKIGYPVLEDLCYITKALINNNRFDDAISIFEECRSGCDAMSYELLSITSIAVKEHRLDLLEYMNVEHIEVYKVLMDMEDSSILEGIDRSIIRDILLDTGIFDNLEDAEMFEEGEIKIEDAIYGDWWYDSELEYYHLSGRSKREVIRLIRKNFNLEHKEGMYNKSTKTFINKGIICYPNMETHIYKYQDYCPYSVDISVAYWMYYGNGIIRD